MAADVPTLAWPVRRAGIGFAQVEQDSLEDVHSSVGVITTVEQGSLGFDPALGLPALELLANVPSADAIGAAIERQDPRASVQVLRVPDMREDGWDQLHVQVALADDEDDA